MVHLVSTVGLLTYLGSTSGYSIVGTSSPTKCKLVQPAGAKCGEQYKFTTSEDEAIYSSIANPQIVETVEQCAALCSRRVVSPKLHQQSVEVRGGADGFCYSFYYDTNAKVCQLSGYNLTQIFGTGPGSSSPRDFYDSKCFDCGAICHQPYGAQLLDNGDFENQLFGPWYTYHGTLGKGHDSKRSFNCDTSLSKAYCQLDQNFNACPNETYLFQFDYLFSVDNSSKPVKLAVNFEGNPSYTYFSSQKIQDPSQLSWKTAHGYIQPSGYHFGPSFQFGGNLGPTALKNTYIDNVHISRVSKPMFQPKTPSQFSNGGFESGALTPWKAHPYRFQKVKRTFEVVTPGLNGSYAVGYSTQNNENDSDCGVLSQELETKPGTVYILSFNVYIEPGLKFNDWDVNFRTGPPEDQSIHSFTPKRGTTTISIPIYSSSNTTLFSLTCSHEQNTKGAIIFDNFSWMKPQNGPFT